MWQERARAGRGWLSCSFVVDMGHGPRGMLDVGVYATTYSCTRFIAVSNPLLVHHHRILSVLAFEIL